MNSANKWYSLKSPNEILVEHRRVAMSLSRRKINIAPIYTNDRSPVAVRARDFERFEARLDASARTENQEIIDRLGMQNLPVYPCSSIDVKGVKVSDQLLQDLTLQETAEVILFGKWRGTHTIGVYGVAATRSENYLIYTYSPQLRTPEVGALPVEYVHSYKTLEKIV